VTDTKGNIGLEFAIKSPDFDMTKYISAKLRNAINKFKRRKDNNGAEAENLFMTMYNNTKIQFKRQTNIRNKRLRTNSLFFQPIKTSSQFTLMEGIIIYP
jgi:hypothetical protein